MAKVEESESAPEVMHGHITSISVLRTHRRLGIAGKLMKESHREMHEIYNA
jgi:peptide alpha-N-acetyltransferase